MSTDIRQISIAEFTAFVQQPANAPRRFELINGEIVEVPSNPFASVIADLILYAIQHWLISNGKSGYVTGEGGGFIIEGSIFAPDVAYVRELPTSQGYEQIPPVLAVEVISDPRNNTEQTDLRRKLAIYLQAGVVVWVVDHVAQQVEIHRAGQSVDVLGLDDSLSGEDWLPGLTIPVKELFPE